MKELMRLRQGIDKIPARIRQITKITAKHKFKIVYLLFFKAITGSKFLEILISNHFIHNTIKLE
jgi:hypothetical protein